VAPNLKDERSSSSKSSAQGEEGSNFFLTSKKALAQKIANNRFRFCDRITKGLRCARQPQYFNRSTKKKEGGRNFNIAGERASRSFLKKERNGGEHGKETVKERI